ncbi:type II toxin-antitoxin system RelE/ParE family toxin [Caballeronia sp. LZ035]|uniref:type II toxin-antitoxin system RelE/ParE family toxin n=1 Tax=Caballeronia sp. LZ035 TaxID=3038568 RepID=UPI00286740FF|nr:type II toxin-antitoxin system RelE/ParE family toxin [Caballeronia sp. LZ035]MDR5763303.1 type II toxin-antitoxin system RelE/ParE family toxin [Caballeronia sp. LZ035]
MSWRVQFAPEALDQLRKLEKRIVDAGAPIAAERYVDSIVDFCMKLETFAARGVARDDLLPGLRITHFRKRAIVAYILERELVSVVGVFYGGQDYEAALAQDDE